MSDLLTHQAVFDDAWGLARSLPEIPVVFHEALATHGEIARVASVCRAGGKMFPVLMEYARNEASPLHLAFAIGIALHFPADHFMKPLMSRLADADWNRTHHAMQGREVSGVTPLGEEAIREISAYYDCHVFREVYHGGRNDASPLTSFLIAHYDGTPERAMERFLAEQFRRALLRAHTVKPVADEPVAYVSELHDQLQPLYLDPALYARVWANPDPAKVEKYGVTTEFYRVEDPAVAAARRGETEPTAIRSAVEDGVNQGGYGQAVALGVRLLMKSAAWWRNEGELPSVRQA